MALNKFIAQAKIPTFDNAVKVFNEDDEKKAVLMLKLDVKRNYKPDGEQYYPSDILDAKAFGKTAQFIYKYFPAGSDIVIDAEIRKGDNYEDKDGGTVYGQMYVHINNAYFAGSKGEGGTTEAPKSNSRPSGSAPAKPRSTNPLAGRRSSVI